MTFQSFFNGKVKQNKQKNKTTDSEESSIVTKRDIMEKGDSVYENATALSAMAEAFEELSGIIKEHGLDFDLSLKPFCHACSYVSVLFGFLGFAFKFAEMEYTSKVRDLERASATYGTLNNILDFDVRNHSVKIQGSLSRNLRRVRQGLDLMRVLFKNFLSADNYSLREAASSAYQDVCAPYHTWGIRTAAFAGMHTLPTKEQLVINLHETAESTEKHMRRYIDASLPVIEYIDNLFNLRRIPLNW
ncbi:transfer/carrier protein [Lithospermum erythrorhizon]|uniref:Transfer/carrier protein n=1 Tax=Lithospermum erythrorhizon TaxID=34254 RepID=A0AAV3PN92_LITER